MKKRTLWMGLMLATVLSNAQAELKGAGSSFASQLYRSWSQSIAKAPESRLDYAPVGSGAGIKAAQDRTVDFGASDRPLNRAALAAAGLAQFPAAIGGAVLMTSLPGIDSEKIKLDGDVVARIYLGTIKKWNDPAIQALNPDLPLPATAVVPVFRSESSGTSFVLTSYLSKINANFKTDIGPTSNLSVSTGRGGKTSTEIIKVVRETAGAIGYVDYSIAMDLGLPTVQMKNQWGKFVKANHDSLQLAMRAADWELMSIDQDPTFEMDLTDTGCPGCWPIASATYVLVPLKDQNTNSVRVLDFFEQALQRGDEIAIKEGYVPLPSRAKNMINVAMRRWYSSLEKSGVGKSQRKSEGGSEGVAMASR